MCVAMDILQACISDPPTAENIEPLSKLLRENASKVDKNILNTLVSALEQEQNTKCLAMYLLNHISPLMFDAAGISRIVSKLGDCNMKNLQFTTLTHVFTKCSSESRSGLAVQVKSFFNSLMKDERNAFPSLGQMVGEYPGITKYLSKEIRSFCISCFEEGKKDASKVFVMTLESEVDIEEAFESAIATIQDAINRIETVADLYTNQNLVEKAWVFKTKNEFFKLTSKSAQKVEISVSLSKHNNRLESAVEVLCLMIKHKISNLDEKILNLIDELLENNPKCSAAILAAFIKRGKITLFPHLAKIATILNFLMQECKEHEFSSSESVFDATLSSMISICIINGLQVFGINLFDEIMIDFCEWIRNLMQTVNSSAVFLIKQVISLLGGRIPTDIRAEWDTNLLKQLKRKPSYIDKQMYLDTLIVSMAVPAVREGNNIPAYTIAPHVSRATKSNVIVQSILCPSSFAIQKPIN